MKPTMVYVNPRSMKRKHIQVKVIETPKKVKRKPKKVKQKDNSMKTKRGIYFLFTTTFAMWNYILGSHSWHWIWLCVLADILFATVFRKRVDSD